MPHNEIVEDMAPWTGQMMAIGVRPAPKSAIRKVLSSLPCVR